MLTPTINKLLVIEFDKLTRNHLIQLVVALQLSYVFDFALDYLSIVFMHYAKLKCKNVSVTYILFIDLIVLIVYELFIKIILKSFQWSLYIFVLLCWKRMISFCELFQTNESCILKIFLFGLIFLNRYNWFRIYLFFSRIFRLLTTMYRLLLFLFLLILS